MKYISLFAGIGGFDLALNRLGHTCVYANEWDKYAVQTYEKNFGHTPDSRSIKDVPESEIPDHDLLVGGFPCQAFSVAGKRRGFEDIRGTLFFDIARILATKKPTYLLLENVKGLLNHDGGRTFETIVRTIDELGYELQWQVLNSKHFGVPQNRERVFIIGHLRREPRPQIFPFRKTDKGNGKMELWSNSPRQISPTIRTATGGYHTPTIRYPLKFLQRNQRRIEGDYSYTIDGANTGGIKQLDKIRRLTPLECERLQGFPDDWTQGVSDTQRYKQLGNAVTVNVVYAIAKKLYA